MTRRSVLKGGGVLALAAWGVRLAPPSRAVAALPPPPFTQLLRWPTVLTDADITLPIIEAEVPILPGAATRMWTFGGEFPGPTIRRPTGSKTRVTFEHRIPAASTLTIHHHGHHTASIHDGQPMSELIAAGGSRTYVYDHVAEGAPLQAAMRWYHDHSHGRTNRNTWKGLLGLFVLDDPAEADLGIPTDRELLLVVSERSFDEGNQLTDPFAVADPAADSVGVGDTILINAVPQPYVEVVPARYRIRILNATTFRPYNLGFASGPGLVQIGTESGLLPRPIARQRVLLGPAERADLVVDFSALAGSDLVLSSAAEDGVMRLAGSTGSVTADLIQFRVRGAPAPPPPLAAELRSLPSWVADLGQIPDRVLAFGVGVDPATLRRVWTINGRTYDHHYVAAKPELGTTETWLLVNLSHTTHSIHLHDVDWKVVSRNGSPPDPAESGLKETFRLDPGDIVAVGTKFTDHLGSYMVHCHMLSHEDHGMMTTFEVVPPGEGDRPPLPGTLTGLTAAESARVAGMLAEQAWRPGRPANPPASPLVLERGSSAHAHG